MIQMQAKPLPRMKLHTRTLNFNDPSAHHKLNAVTKNREKVTHTVEFVILQGLCRPLNLSIHM